MLYVLFDSLINHLRLVSITCFPNEQLTDAIQKHSHVSKYRFLSLIPSQVVLFVLCRNQLCFFRIPVLRFSNRGLFPFLSEQRSNKSWRWTEISTLECVIPLQRRSKQGNILFFLSLRSVSLVYCANNICQSKVWTKRGQ